MKTRGAALAAALAAAIWAAPLAANARADDKEGAGPGERIQDLELTDAQEAKVAETRKEYRPKVQAAAKELAAAVKEEVDKIRAVLTAEQREKLQSWKDERRERREGCLTHRIACLKDLDITDAEMDRIAEIRQEFRPKVERAMDRLHGLLSDAQKKAREVAFKAGKNRREMLEALGLTDEQKEKARAVGKEVAGLFRDEVEKIRDVLTESQKERLADLKEERRERVRDRMAHAIANFKDLNLTDEQAGKIAEIRKEYRPKVHEAGNKLRATIRQEVDAILAAIKG
jgi:Spy/CpxP family protein refolding chaperone